jgi:Asp-tRNA(Asn)/Glu-tRNA(Gln) amidotransferase A subunit family amidase
MVFDAQQLPRAVQVTGAWGDEGTVVAVAEQLFTAAPEVQERTPEIPTG